ncbi:MAG: 3-phosphoshikimate 1-carboxyvinyltransferase [Patescibacteria group bacterium]|jgi:3-phosphoshikimate 1-carboxyvinyltransferase
MSSKSYKILPLKHPISKTITMPGSKSLSNRCLVMAAFSRGQSVITGASESDDCRIMVSALKKLGVKIKKNRNRLIVFGNNGEFQPFKGKIDVGAAGTAARFLLAICALAPGEIILDGTYRMRQRPIGELVNALRKLGAGIQYQRKANCLPVKIRGGNLTGRKVSLPGRISSQFFTSLLLIAPVLKQGIEISVIGGQISKSYIDMTLDGLKKHGVRIKNQDYKKYIVRPDARYKPGHYQVEGDASGASYFFALAALTKNRIRIKNILPDSSQGDAKFPDLLKRMGAKVIKNQKENWIEVSGTGRLKGISVNMENMPDTAQTLAIVAAFAKDKTKITGLSTLRHKETDRLSALKNELKKMGVRSEITANSITIHGGRPGSAIIDTYGDHRMAMAFAIAGSRIPDLAIKDPAVVSKSFPEFWSLLKSIGVKTTSS